MSNSFDKMSVLDSFIEEVNSYLPEIETNLEHLAKLAQSSQTTSDMDAIEETYRRTHTIGGSASMMDFPGLSHVAYGMEDILGDALESIAVLDTPVIALLQRSLKRLRVLLNGIRSGINEEKIIAEDDADYTQYRTALEASQNSSQHNVEVQDVQDPRDAQDSQAAPEPVVDHEQQAEEATLPTSLPSFDEVLASFRTPTEDEEALWPEEVEQEPVATSLIPMPVQEHTELPVDVDQPSEISQPSALDTLVASTRQNTAPHAAVNVDIEQPTQKEPAIVAQDRNKTSLVAQSAQSAQLHALEPQASPISDEVLTLSYASVQNEVQGVVSSAASLKDMSAQLRAAMTIIEDQRNEYRSFLDGSKDALERMEDWAGQAMGLNLKNSPERVRRYLPLSVMWVSNSKLKGVLELLTHVTSGVEATDEQLHTFLSQLTTSVTAFGDELKHAQYAQEETTKSYTLTQEPGWTAWEMQPQQQENGVHERVTFERRGDMDTLRAEVEANIREEVRGELQKEYEARSNAAAQAQAALERRIRKEVAQELEEQQRIRERNALPQETPSQLEARLRNEIEIQVRQEFLQQIDLNTGLSSQTLMPPIPPSPSPSNFAERALQLTSGTTVQSETPSSSSDKTITSVTPAVSTTRLAPTEKAASRPSSSESSTSSTPSASNVGTEQRSASASLVTSDIGEEAAEIFRLEAEEHLQTIGTYVAVLEKDPTNRESIQGIRRATHTLKGAAAMMGFRAIADLSHVSEDLLDMIMEEDKPVTSNALSLILDTAETLDILIMGNSTDSTTDEARVQVLRTRYAEELGKQDTTPKLASDMSFGDDESDNENVENVSEATSITSILSEEPEVSGQRLSREEDLSVRVRLQKLDELVNLFGELLVNRSVLEERLERLVRLVADVGISSNRLRDVGQKLESRFEAATLPSGRSVVVMPGDGNTSVSNGKNGRKNGVSHLDDFDALEMDRYTEFHQVARGLSEGISDMSTLSTEMDTIIRECENVFSRENRLSTTVQDRLMKTRLVPLSAMTPRLYRAAVSVALKQHKSVDFLVKGEETEIDRMVFEEIGGPLLHLVRNAVNHGIETPEVRVQQGKPPKGQITFSASYEGNLVVITIREDGHGIEPEQVRNVAIARGLISPDHVLSENELIELIFRPGFSTAEVLSEESGRGVGLDVVRDSVSRLRGTIEVESTPGHGTAFTMKFPTSLTIQTAMMVRVGDQQFAIPISIVESIGRLDTFKRTTLAGQPAVVVRNDLYVLSMLAQYLNLPTSQIDDKSHVLLINAGGNRVALLIDEVKGKLDIVMKNLGPHLRHVYGIAGGTILGNGQVTLVLEMSELLSSRNRPVANVVGGSALSPIENAYQQMPQLPQTPQTPVSANKLLIDTVNSQGVGSPLKPSTGTTSGGRGKHVLVVDDSPSVRRVVGNMLKQHGWEVQMARDGVEALEMITRETPAAVLLDVEMPRMDGYELVATVRAQEQYRTLPLVMLTSRAAAKHQQRAMQLGATAYLVKPYQDEELLNILNSNVYGTAVR